MLMDFHKGAVHHDGSEFEAFVQSVEEPVEHSRFDPAVEPLIDCPPSAEHRWKVPPGSAGAGDPEDSLDGLAVVSGGAARGPRVCLGGVVREASTGDWIASFSPWIGFTSLCYSWSGSSW